MKKKYIDVEQIQFHYLPISAIGDVYALKNEVDKIPAADVQEVTHAHWIIIEHEYLNCSNCASSYFTGAESSEQARKWLEKGYAYSYCPWCGAKMDGKDEEDD